MAILKVLQYPDLRLRRKANRASDIKDKKIQKVIENMIETLLAQESCAALASTQLDLEDPPSITVINYVNNSKENDILCLINPEIVEKSGRDIKEEGCMSVAPKKISTKVKRAGKIKVKALDRNGNNLEFETTGFLARCIQHEHDHLQGILYIDHLSKLKRSFIDRKITKLQQNS